MQLSYHTVVVGAGPAGLECARELCGYGYTVLVLEKSKTPGDPNFSTCGIPYFSKDDFNVPDEAIVDTFNKVSFLSQREKTVIEGDFNGGYVLDFRKYKNLLAEDIKKKGGEVVYGALVTGVGTDHKGHVRNVAFVFGEESHKVSCKYLVDATSRDTTLSEMVGLSKEKHCLPTVGEEYIVKVEENTEVNNFYKRNLSIHIGSKYFRNGYAWVFPFGHNVFKVGVIRYDMPKNSGESLDWQLNRFLKTVFGRKYEILEKHGGTVFLTDENINAVKGNYVMIGDSIDMCNPLFAEGVRPSLDSARICAKVIDDAYLTKSPDLGKFNEEIQKYKGWDWAISRFFASLLFHAPFDLFRDWLAVRVRRLSFQQTLDIGFRYRFRNILKMLV